MEIHLTNYGTINKNKVSIGGLALFFSYETIVAFHSNSTGLVCSANSWSMTTGKFLNEIEPDHKKRVSYEVFQEKLKKALFDGVVKGVIEELSLETNPEIRRHSIGLLKEFQRPSFEIKKS